MVFSECKDMSLMVPDDEHNWLVVSNVFYFP